MILNGHELEYIDETHTYLVDGMIVPSVTELISRKLGNKYKYVPENVLREAQAKGTAVHKAIEMYERFGIEAPLPELYNYQFLKRQYGFECFLNEVPVVIFENVFERYKPVAAGRLDMAIRMDGKIGLADIKRTRTLDKNYLAYQLNLYRIGFQQCYGKKVEFLRGLHLRDRTRKFVNIPINEELAMQLIKEVKDEY